MGGEKKESNILPVLYGVIGVGTLVLVGVWELAGPSVHGTTPAQIEALSLAGTPEQIAKGLSSTEVESASVRARFKRSAGKPYEYFELSWDPKSPDAPTSMRLVPEHERSEEDRGEEVIAALARRFHALHDGAWQWGRVSISAHKKDGELEASVESQRRGKPNPLFERQMDVARQILLEAAFGIPIHASDADLAELVGTGYKTADVGKIDPQTPIENAPALMTTRFPGALHDTSSSWEAWEVAIDHPLFESVTLMWDKRPGGPMTHVRFSVSDAYASSREALHTCLANALGAPEAKVTDYVFTVGPLSLVLRMNDVALSAPRGGFDGASLSKLFDALAGCRDKTENTGSRGDGRKK